MPDQQFAATSTSSATCEKRTNLRAVQPCTLHFARIVERARNLTNLSDYPRVTLEKLGSHQTLHTRILHRSARLRQVVTGHFAYYAVPTNSRALSAFRHHVTDLWRRTLRRRSQKDGFTWDRMTRLVDDCLSQPRILHPWPDVRFDVRHLR
jgi:hypothetical protein